MNKADAERLAWMLEFLGFKQTKNEKEANLICVQACSVRQSAVDRIHGRLIKWRKLKQRRPKNNPLITLLTGCILAQDKRVLSKRFDLVIEITELTSELPARLKSILPKLVIKSVAGKPSSGDFWSLAPKYSNNFQAFIPIQIGCNNFCSFCAVPYTRGREISLSSQEIIKEVESLVNQGFKEIFLLGQNVNTYRDQKNKTDFPELLRFISKIKGDFWLRFVSSNPWDMSLRTIKVIAASDKICQYVHLALQSGSDKILTRMNRRYNQRRYLKLIKRIRHLLPKTAIGTDIIVGFPGETAADFKATVAVMKKVKFDLAFIAKYSPRDGTAAAKNFIDNVSPAEKKRREKILTKILTQTAAENNKKYLDETVEVLVDGFAGGMSSGKTKTYKTVKFKGSSELIGKTVKVKIATSQAFGLSGNLV